jgi:DnaK suppressor protein
MTKAMATQVGYEAQERQLKAKMAELLGQHRDHDALRIQNSADPFDQIQASVERDLLVGLLNHDARLREDVRHAFEQIEAGTYGICEDCDREIAPARLKAIPWARYCVRCQDCRDREVSEFDVFPEAA